MTHQRLPAPDPATLDDALLKEWLLSAPLTGLLEQASASCAEGHGRIVSFSRKVFIPLTQLCRDRCHYCTFSRPLDRGRKAFLTPEEVMEIARAGQRAGCTEALFTLGEKPELRHAAAREELVALGYPTTLAYLEAMCDRVQKETGLLPHVNAGTMGRAEIAALRRVSASQGIMLETISDRLGEKGGPHYRSPDKVPSVRLDTIRMAGELSVPFTSGILIGIGETRDERLDALLALRDLSRQYGHIQEIIVQNFRAKARTPMANHPEPDMDDLLWTIAAARLIFGPEMNIQAPPNLSSGDYPRLLAAGINDWGGISPVTPDHVNPEAPWPAIEKLRAATAETGRIMVPRLPVYPAWNRDVDRWQDTAMAPLVRRMADAEGFARDDEWSPGTTLAPRVRPPVQGLPVDPALTRILDRAATGHALTEPEIVRLFATRDAEVEQVCAAANGLRRQVCGDVVTYVVNRNINYTNICAYKCGFCAFSKGSTDDHLRGKPYDLDLGEVVRRTVEAAERGATEVCLQGGIHPHYTGDTYLNLARSIRDAVPDMHIHAFSPLEIAQGAATLGIPVASFLKRLKQAGLSTLPGTAAEVLDDEVRVLLAPDKLTTAEWLSVVEDAHRQGLRTTATIMFGHVDRPEHWARHLIHIRELQRRTGGFTEFVPLPFVHMEAPMALRGRTRRGPTFREVRLMHAVARLVLHGLIDNIQLSWVKLGPAGAHIVLDGGVNDLGGTLMNESISRAAGTQHGQEMPPEAMEALITATGRPSRQRTTLYGAVNAATQARGRNAAPLAPMVLTTPRRHINKIRPVSADQGRKESAHHAE
ncbi:5-amino-6-(D-ribitylamino)uracil--L-tyrosine 4-hydroxyphenyl transferase CofH [Niveispirillum sp.]|uniref:5-amino-6-(D-ribitylamino)uracil--L-tyrosine 4-hydroxyphenyl transferase CofH n=1 Tax=Niveispirillum sp. TaxID=1917217 RepID=UPI001B5A2ACC|nr:5-amino-6-(D-ribitylamino)uracil--L-tyrosine 4-hydroxyphenyl transferase CofH [Niveispirillum sp.]MBP7338454.1 5-amino-6-(D-ribitylamino)uracil--L-tyrosine 4-hydroxyphenyl transferase CofH [Niveispirillum sp.]